jgi:serine/tyrosine/threonine adenylyltransferase
MPFTMQSPFDTFNFQQRFLQELPGDRQLENVPRSVMAACYSDVLPTPVPDPKLLAFSLDVAKRLDLSEADCLEPGFTRVLAGNALTASMRPYALCYGGHQFGHWAGQLGDGRVINLGEIINREGQHWTLQLKGAGKTPYSRTADGLAVLRSSVREFLCSEAMHHLGVPTTRALSLVSTGTMVMRDMFYDGNPKWEPGAVVCRVAPSFLRFGSLQILAARNELDHLQRLLDYVIRTDFPHLGPPSKSVYLHWLEEVCRRTAQMIVHWQRVGFVHGVMNTDNMSLLGLTMDYGPYGWLENYDPDWTPNTTDAEQRRYRFGNQPQIAFWNLLQLANALYPLIKSSLALQTSLQTYVQHFDQGWQSMMAGKLGLSRYQAAVDEDLIRQLQQLMHESEADMTLFYRGLADIGAQHTVADFLALLRQVSYQSALTPQTQQAAIDWFTRYRARLLQDAEVPELRRQRMNALNPKYVLRNYLAQQSIEQLEQGDPSMMLRLQEVFRYPYDDQPDAEHFAQKRPDWAKQRAGCSMLSCSS